MARIDESRRPARLSPLERFLCLFTEMRPGEGPTGLILFADVFLLLCAYYFVKPLRDGWIAVSDVGGLSKMEVKAYASFAQSLLLALVVSAYARLSTRWTRRTLITRATLVCMSNLILFWLLQPGILVANLPGAGIAFYLWVGMFGVFVVAQFWSFATDLYSDERGRRLLPLIAIGATAGATAGSLLTELMMRRTSLDSGALLLAANVPLAASIVLTRLADTRGPIGEGGGPAASGPAAAASGGGGRAAGRAGSKGGGDAKDHGGLEALRFLARHRYLVAVAVVTLLTNWVNTNGENLLFQVVGDVLQRTIAARGMTDPAAIQSFVRAQTTAFYGDFFFWVNACALVLQAFVASRLLKYGGLAAILLLLPVIALGSYSAMALLPILSMVKGMKIAENATNYSINNSARHILWLPTTAEMKYKAKPAIDTLVVRLGDGLAALTVMIGEHVYDLSTRDYFLFNVVLVVVWLAVSWGIVREHRRLVAEGATLEPVAALT